MESKLEPPFAAAREVWGARVAKAVVCHYTFFQISSVELPFLFSDMKTNDKELTVTVILPLNDSRRSFKIYLINSSENFQRRIKFAGCLQTHFQVKQKEFKSKFSQ